MPQDADRTGREILPIPTSRIETPSSFDARDASAPQQSMLRAPNEAPNVVIVFFDDMGFGIPTAFAGCVDMLTTDRLARSGLRYPRTEQFLERTQQRSDVTFQSRPQHSRFLAGERGHGDPT